MKLRKKIKKRIYYSTKKLLWPILKYLVIKFFQTSQPNSLKNNKYKSNSSLLPTKTKKSLELSIIITTFDKRFFTFALPLISQIRSIVDTPIFVIINGNYTKNFANNNLQLFLAQLGNFSNIYPSSFANFHGCAELWNTGIVNSDSEYCLILNDDINLFPFEFDIELEKIVDLLDNEGLLTINNSFSYFAISRKCISEVGFFDEHFLGIGNEDIDYTYRYKSVYKKSHYDFGSSNFFNLSDNSRDSEISENLGEKYSKFNSNIFREFYDTNINQENQVKLGQTASQKRISVNPRPLWEFRSANYKKLAE